MIKHMIVVIDEEKCTGCGKCVTPCAEGAIRIIDGKAKVISEELCDGMGFCIGICPEGVISMSVRRWSSMRKRQPPKPRPRMYQSSVLNASQETRTVTCCRYAIIGKACGSARSASPR
uniref:Ion-translocating oxidoreductase complex subunit B n=1 Tax=Candidatus Methanogaster sp. ANME-2c ERB4 TaxID=2759911 RepID=A0A7G9YPY0_9EURY|nr:ion-translocating oxidoreductase complex subunit B [Methanosarcinales archaeon ANME-2c ERB4]